MAKLNLTRVKFLGRFTILQFMGIIGGSALLITLALHYC